IAFSHGTDVITSRQLVSSVTAQANNSLIATVCPCCGMSAGWIIRTRTISNVSQVNRREGIEVCRGCKSNIDLIIAVEIELFTVFFLNNIRTGTNFGAYYSKGTQVN